MLSRRTLFSMVAKVFGGLSILPFIGEKKAAGDISLNPNDISGFTHPDINNVLYCRNKLLSYPNVTRVEFDQSFANGVGIFYVYTTDNGGWPNCHFPELDPYYVSVMGPNAIKSNFIDI
jgi:hypothetical protein